ncbi:MAG: phage tail terminator protein [Polyangiales bacterium]
MSDDIAYDTDYLAAEGLLVERLREELTTVPERHVLTAPDLAEVDEQQQFTPAVHVIYAGDEVVESDDARAGDGGEQIVRQRWYTVAAVRNVREPRAGAGAREAAGEILAEILPTLAGWVPGAGYGPLVRRQAPEAAYSHGYFYVPLLWSTTIATE